MIYITQLIYIKENEELVFKEFEDIAIPIIAKYNGKLLFRIQPDDNAYVEANIDKPYEIHIIQFESEDDFQQFMQDPERKKFLHLKEQSVRSAMLIKGKIL